MEWESGRTIVRGGRHRFRSRTPSRYSFSPVQRAIGGKGSLQDVGKRHNKLIEDGTVWGRIHGLVAFVRIKSNSLGFGLPMVIGFQKLHEAKILVVQGWRYGFRLQGRRFDMIKTTRMMVFLRDLRMSSRQPVLLPWLLQESGMLTLVLVVVWFNRVIVLKGWYPSILRMCRNWFLNFTCGENLRFAGC